MTRLATDGAIHPAVSALALGYDSRARGVSRGPGRRGVMALLAAPAFLIAPPFLADPALLRTPPLMEATLPLVTPSFHGSRSAAWTAEMRVEWSDFVKNFVTKEGRVVDTGHGGISHSEGQGSGMLFAEEAGDLPNFERLLEWTRVNLARRGDGLHAWRYSPDAITPVSDANNATDGDILIAWALQRAAARFSRPDFARRAVEVAGSILDRCTRMIGQRMVLLPGAFGFERRDRVILNPSYYLFPALLDFEALVPGPQWRQLVHDGLQICCRDGAFGRWDLPADWLEVPHDIGTPIRCAADRPARFSWDAVRVPLNLVWGRRWGEPMLYASAQYWTDLAHGGRVPAWVSLRDDVRAPYDGHAGVQAIARLTAAAAEQSGVAPDLPRVRQATDYFAAALTIMARLAWQDSRAT